MSFKHHPLRHQSIVSSVEADTFEENLFDSNHNYNNPLINSTMASICKSDEEIARLEQENIYAETSMSIQPIRDPSPIDMRTEEEINADAAYALQLQEEEYSRKSIVPNRSSIWRNKPSSTTTQRNKDTTVFTDAQLAAQLQEEENRRQRQHRLGTTGPELRRGSHPTTNRFNPLLLQTQQQNANRDDDDDNDNDDDNDEPEIIPVPFLPRANQRRVQTNRNNNNNNNNNLPQPPDFPFMFGPFSIAMNRGRRQGAFHNLENTSNDFGPDDYDRLLELDNAVAQKPLSSNQIDQLPTEKFRPTANKNSEENTCNICWDEFEQNQTIRRLPCIHIYHQNCIDKWLKTNNTCPICRLPVFK